AHNVMQREKHHMLFLFQLKRLYSDHWPLSQVAPCSSFLSRHSRNFRLSLRRGQASQVLDLQFPPHPLVDDLSGLTGFDFDPCPEDLVPSDDLIDDTLQRLEIQPPLHSHGPGTVVYGISGLQLIDEPQPLLRER